MTIAIANLSPDQAERHIASLSALLQDAVEAGASVGFLPPLGQAEASVHWRSVFAAMRDGSRVLLAAMSDQALVGAVQLDLCQRANGLHRAEVMKLMVHTSARRMGVGRALMNALEVEALRLRRTTLVLDTRAGDVSENLYQSLGWVRAGAIPRYARSASGQLHDTAFYFKLLD